MYIISWNPVKFLKLYVIWEISKNLKNPPPGYSHEIHGAEISGNQMKSYEITRNPGKSQNSRQITEIPGSPAGKSWKSREILANLWKYEKSWEISSMYSTPWIFASWAVEVQLDYECAIRPPPWHQPFRINCPPAPVRHLTNQPLHIHAVCMFLNAWISRKLALHQTQSKWHYGCVQLPGEWAPWMQCSTKCVYDCVSSWG